MKSSYRIVKAGEGDYHVEAKTLMFWTSMHSTPGFASEEKARDYIRRLTNPEVIAEFESDGSERRQ